MKSFGIGFCSLEKYGAHCGWNSRSDRALSSSNSEPQGPGCHTRQEQESLGRSPSPRTMFSIYVAREKAGRYYTDGLFKKGSFPDSLNRNLGTNIRRTNPVREIMHKVPGSALSFIP